MTYVKVLKKILVNARMIILVNYKYYRKYKIEPELFTTVDFA